jgi:hypothetical protein
MAAPMGLHGRDASTINENTCAFISYFWAGHAPTRRGGQGKTLHGLPLSAMEGPKRLQRGAEPQEVGAPLSGGGEAGALVLEGAAVELAAHATAAMW